MNKPIRVTKRPLVPAAILLSALASSAAASTSYTFTIIAQQGDIIGGREVTFTGGPRINDNGDIAFSGSTLFPDNTFGNAVWSPTAVLAATGDLYGGEILPNFNRDTFQLNNLGEIAVSSSTSPEGVYTPSGRVGAPGSMIGGATLAGGVEASFHYADDGTATFFSEIETATPGVTRTAILTQSQLLITEGDTVGSLTTNDFKPNGINDSIGVDTNGVPYFFELNGPAGRSVLSTQEVFFTVDGVFDSMGVDDINTSDIVANASGEFAFAGFIDGKSGIYTRNRTVIEEGDLLGGMAVGFAFNPEINDAGTVLYSTSFQGVSTEALVTDTDIVITTDDTIGGQSIDFFGARYEINNAGQIVFNAWLNDGQTSRGSIILATPCFDTTTYAAVLSEQTNEYSAGAPGIDDTSSIAMITSAEPVGNLQVNFGCLGDTELVVTWEAPQGQAFEIQPPAGFDEELELALEFQVDGLGALGSINPAITIETKGVSGSSLPNLSSSSFLSGPGGTNVRVGIDTDDIVPGEIYRFTRMTARLTVPAAFDTAFNSPISRFRLIGYAFADSRVVPPPPNAGQWVRLVPACSGDVDGDSDTDVFDFADLAANFGAGPGATRAQGDLTRDGMIDVFDFAELAADFGCGPN